MSLSPSARVVLGLKKKKKSSEACDDQIRELMRRALVSDEAIGSRDQGWLAGLQVPTSFPRRGRKPGWDERRAPCWGSSGFR